MEQEDFDYARANADSDLENGYISYHDYKRRLTNIKIMEETYWSEYE